MRKVLLFSFFAATILSGIGWIFWEQEYKFTLPTPVPAELRQVETGDSVTLELNGLSASSNLFIHFYNNDCPCSRFNISEFESMVRRYSPDVQFLAVVQHEESSDAAASFIDEYDLGIPVIYDKNGAIADSLGVYSTPQAVLIRQGKVFYKGNYNRARFCVSRNTKFAELALEALVNNEEPPYFPSVAYTAYGCELPSNNQNKSRNNWISIF